MQHRSLGSGCASRGGRLGVLRSEGDPVSAPAATYLMEEGPALRPALMDGADFAAGLR
jgi:hypothetical protein